MNPRLLICDHESQEYAEVMLVVGDKYFPLGTTQIAQGYSKEYAMEGMTVRQEIPLPDLGPPPTVDFSCGNMTFRWNEDRTSLTPEKFTMTDGSVYRMELE